MTKTQLIVLLLFLGTVSGIGMILFGILTSPIVWYGVLVLAVVFSAGWYIDAKQILDDEDSTVIDWLGDIVDNFRF